MAFNPAGATGNSSASSATSATASIPARPYRPLARCTTTTAHNDRQRGIGGGFRAPLGTQEVTIGLKGLWGQGVGRYGSSTIADVTLRPNGQLRPLHGFSALSTMELNPTPNFNVVLQLRRRLSSTATTSSAGPPRLATATRSVNMSGCMLSPLTPTAGATGAAPVAPSNCGGSNKDVQEFTAGYWYNFYNGPQRPPPPGLPVQTVRRDLWSGAGGTANPGNGAHGTDNMIFTSFRYYLP